MTSEGDGSPDAAPTIQTVQRAALILSAFTVSQPYLSLKEITTRLGASKATAHRYTKALRAANLLRYDEQTALYSLGPQVLTLAASARAGLPIVTVAEPYLERLVKQVDETVVLSVWDGEAPTVVRSADNTDQSVRISVRAGARLDLTGSAQGRVFCAFLPPDLLRQSPELAGELATIRAQGVAVDSPAPSGVRTVAAPVFEGATIIATMAVVGTTASVPAEVDSTMAKSLAETAGDLSRRLGSLSPA
jgi:DNA-binding IclR family transcriptional regulator